MAFETHVEDLPYAHGGSAGLGFLREKPEYFKVYETLTFTPSGEGEHEFLYIQKIGLNTEDVVKQLAIYADVSRRSVSYAGMKDKHAVTRQWFSVQLPGKVGPAWDLLECDGLDVLETTRHLKKLKRGGIKKNEFEIILSQVDADKDAVMQRANEIKKRGVPNYFMEQRFGYLCQNISRVHDLFLKNEAIRNKKMKSLFISSARSFLFNTVLAKRVAANNWDKAIEADAFMLNGTRQCFKEDSISDEIVRRLLEHDIHPTGPLFGKSSGDPSNSMSTFEESILLKNTIFCDGLIKEKVDASRRSLRVLPESLQLDWLSRDRLKLSFSLPSGSYATAVIRELIDVTKHFN